MQEEYLIYILKKSPDPGEKEILKELVNEHKIVLKDFSETFCQLYVNNKTSYTDRVCLSDIAPQKETKVYDLPFLN